MVFTIKTLLDKETSTNLLMLSIKDRLFSYGFGATEIELNNYLEQTYGVGLKQICLSLLLQKTNIAMNNKNEIIMTFKTQKADRLASLITYGNGKIPGSRIIKYALNID